MKKAFTLVELLVVLAIIALLSALLIGSVLSTMQLRDRAKTLDLIQALQMALAMDSNKPFPDNLVIPVTDAEKRVGYFIFDPMDEKPGIVNDFVNGSGFAFDHSAMINEDNVLIDSWGNPIHYVLGDFKNRLGSVAYDSALPQDLNKPKDGDKPANQSDWNTSDVGKFSYVYSEGPSQEQETWVYYGN